MASFIALRPATLIASVLIAAGTACAAAPTAEKVFEENIKALGGETAIRAVKSRFYDGTMNNKKAKVVSRITSWQVAPDKSLTEIETLGVSTFTQGYDGTEAWSNDGKGTVKVLDGDEAAAVADAALFFGDLEWKTRYSDAKTVGETTFESKPAIEVAVTMKSVTTKDGTKPGSKRSIFFDPKTWLQLGVRETITSKGADGKDFQQQLITVYDEYRDVGGIKSITKFTQKVNDMEIVSTFKTVEANIDASKVVFTKPQVAAKPPETAAKPPADAGVKTDKKDPKK